MWQMVRDNYGHWIPEHHQISFKVQSWGHTQQGLGDHGVLGSKGSASKA